MNIRSLANKAVATIKKIPRHMRAKAYIATHQHRYRGLKHLFVNKHSDSLLIVFSGFSLKRRYNYFLPFSKLNISQLYILDMWAYLGSYYWYDKGSDAPEQLVSELIEHIKNKYGFKSIITAGTSKGGTAALYYGLKHNASAMYAGANQYLVGTYLGRDDHIIILRAMMGDDAPVEDAKRTLDSKMNGLLREKAGAHGEIHLFYSKNEHTYQEQIIPLKKDLDLLGYNYFDDIADFGAHDEVALFFPSYLKEQLR